MPKRDIRVVLKGAYGWGNLGDDALMLAALKVLEEKYARDEIGIVARPAPYLEKLAPGVCVLPNHGWGFPKGELLVYGGGTQFFSFPKTMRSATLTNRALHHLSNPVRAKEFMLRRLKPLESAFPKIAALGIGCGPFVPGSWEEHYARNLFSRMSFVSVRDPESERICKEWNAPNFISGADLCWLSHIPTARENRISTNSRKPKIGVIVRNWSNVAGGESYETALLKTVRHMSDRAEFHFILFQSADSNWREIAQKENRPLLEWNPMTDSIQSFLERMTAFDLIITTRYHGALFATQLGVPFIAVEIEPKLRMAAETFSGSPPDQASEWIWPPPFDQESLERKIRNALERLDSIRKSLGRAAHDQTQSALAMKEKFHQFVRSIRTHQG